MQADITAPTGPTHITDEENTTFGNPREGEEAVDPKRMFKPLHMIVETEEGDSVLEVNEEKAKIRIPRKRKTHEEDENDVLPAIRDDKAL